MVEPVLREGTAIVARLPGLVQNADELYKWLEENVQFDAITVATPGGPKVAPRKNAAFASDAAVGAYNFSGQTTRATVPIPPLLQDVVFAAAQRLGSPPPNYLLINRYDGPDDYIGKHADDEGDMEPDADIISISVGHERDFVFHPKRGGTEVARIRLRHGDVVAMRGSCQRVFKHSVPRPNRRHPCPPTRVCGKLTTRRYNITARRMKRK